MSEKICSTDGCENNAVVKRSKCQPCLTKQHAAWRAANIEKAHEYESQYRAANAEKFREYDKKPERREKQRVNRRERFESDAEFREKCRLRSAAVYAQKRLDPEWMAKQREIGKLRTPEQRRKETLKSRYKMTTEDYAALVESQNGVCAICSREPTEKEGKLGVDHNHKTGAVRQLLCRYCNHLVDILEDKGELVLRAYQYIARHTIQSTE
jgi:hypothetical protein